MRNAELNEHYRNCLDYADAMVIAIEELEDTYNQMFRCRGTSIGEALDKALYARDRYLNAKMKGLEEKDNLAKRLIKYIKKN